MTLTLAQTNKIVALLSHRPRQLNIIVNVAVCDNQGQLIAFNRMDRAYAEGDLWVAKYKSGGDRSLKQTAALLPPRVTVKRGCNN
jgi:uncharacterized protein GlcG (DUF336 family)